MNSTTKSIIVFLGIFASIAAFDQSLQKFQQDEYERLILDHQNCLDDNNEKFRKILDLPSENR